jgi:hypothetical protein
MVAEEESLMATAEQQPGQPGAWPALDIVKAACVAGMILAHAFYWLATDAGTLLVDPQSRAFPWVARLMVLGVLPMMLPFTAGCVLRAGPFAGTSDGPIARRQLVALCGSAVFIGCCGVLMNVLAAGWTVYDAWNVLQFVGLSMVVTMLLLLRRLGVAAVAVAGVVALLVGPALVPLLPAESYLAGILLGDADGYHAWPFFPWYALVAGGFVMTDAYMRWRGNAGAFAARLAAGGVVLTGIAWTQNSLVPALDPDDLLGAQLFSPSPALVLAIAGWACLLFASAILLAGRVDLRRYGAVNCYSKGILWVYIAHMVVGVRLTDWYVGAMPQSVAREIPGTPVLILFPLFLLLFSWGAGYLTIRLLQEKRIIVRLRPRRAA